MMTSFDAPQFRSREFRGSLNDTLMYAGNTERAPGVGSAEFGKLLETLRGTPPEFNADFRERVLEGMGGMIKVWDGAAVALSAMRVSMGMMFGAEPSFLGKFATRSVATPAGETTLSGSISNTSSNPRTPIQRYHPQPSA